MSNDEISSAFSVGVSDDDLEKLTPEEAKKAFRVSEAEGPGDFELTTVPKDDSLDGYVKSYDAAIPEWSEDYLEAVQEKLGNITLTEVAELSGDLRGPMSQQAEGLQSRIEDIEKQFLELMALRPMN